MPRYKPHSISFTLELPSSSTPQSTEQTNRNRFTVEYVNVDHARTSTLASTERSHQFEMNSVQESSTTTTNAESSRRAPVELLSVRGADLSFIVDGVRYTAAVASTPTSDGGTRFFVHSSAFGTHTLLKHTRLPEPKEQSSLSSSAYVARMPGKVVELLVPNNSMVKAGQALLTTYSMKIESKMLAHQDGVVKFFVEPNQLFADGQVLLDVIADKPQDAKEETSGGK
jgi:acetyl/propionyl-CoA carboxylase alpha subunit